MMTREELTEALKIIYAGLPKDDRPYGCIGAQDAILDHDAEQRVGIVALRGEIEALRKALEFVADDAIFLSDAETVARKALEREHP